MASFSVTAGSPPSSPGMPKKASAPVKSRASGFDDFAKSKAADWRTLINDQDSAEEEEEEENGVAADLIQQTAQQLGCAPQATRQTDRQLKPANSESSLTPLPTSQATRDTVTSEADDSLLEPQVPLQLSAPTSPESNSRKQSAGKPKRAPKRVVSDSEEDQADQDKDNTPPPSAPPAAESSSHSSKLSQLAAARRAQALAKQTQEEASKTAADEEPVGNIEFSDDAEEEEDAQDGQPHKRTGGGLFKGKDKAKAVRDLFDC